MGNGSEALSLPSVLGASLKPGDPHAGTGRNSNIGQATNVGQNQGEINWFKLIKVQLCFMETIVDA